MLAGRGYIAQQYTESPAGACMPTGSTCKTPQPGQRGCAGWQKWEYELLQLSRRSSNRWRRSMAMSARPLRLPGRQKARPEKRFADQAGISVEQTKVCLLAIMYGAKGRQRGMRTPSPKRSGRQSGPPVKVELFQGIAKDVAGAQGCHPEEVATHGQWKPDQYPMAKPSAAPATKAQQRPTYSQRAEAKGFDGRHRNAPQ